ncbi:MAG TPA: hypothetical protein VL742_12145 [Casimicrobiaceae bacterium]|nr:hypothetical protein [Casimicrobiaceae bacterium]
MSTEPSQPKAAASNARSWLLFLIGAIFALLAAVNLWTAVDTTLHAVPATAKVLSTQGGIGRTKPVHAQVEVAFPGERVFRTEVEDSLGLGTWAEGGSIALVCMKRASRSPHCELDSALDRWLFPLLFFAVGCEAIWLALRRRKA